MHINAQINVISSDTQSLAQARKQLDDALQKIAGEHGQVKTQYQLTDLSQIAETLRGTAAFLDTDMREFTDDLMNDFDLKAARFVLEPINGEWSYGILTDSGVEYVGTLYIESTTLDTALLAQIPMPLQMLPLLGAEPDPVLLEQFQSHRYQWVGLLDSVDRETFFTVENIRQLWDQLDDAQQFFQPSRDQALKLAGFPQ